MTALADRRRRLRERAELHLTHAAMDDLRARYPDAATPPYRGHESFFWKRVFVPLYRVVPWALKSRAMHALGMTAERSGWTPPPRRPAEPAQIQPRLRNMR